MLDTPASGEGFRPWYRKKKLYIGLLSFGIAVLIVGYTRYWPQEEQAKFEEVPEYVAIQQFEEYEWLVKENSKRITIQNKNLYEQEKKLNNIRESLVKRIGRYDIKVWKYVVKLEEKIKDLEDAQKKSKRRKKRAIKKPKEIPKRNTELSDDPMGDFELSEKR